MPSLLDAYQVAGSAAGYVGTDEFLAFLNTAASGTASAGWFEGRGILSVLAIVFLGGLALNLTPCVLPMIPINLAILGAGRQAHSRARGFILGSTYGAAMALAYGLIGATVIMTTGTFGAINASPWFNLAVAATFVVLALAMFDVLMIDFSRFVPDVSAASKRRGTLAMAFSMGTVAALLAGACVAPVVIQVVLFSSDLYASGTRAGLALPFVLGLGMAAPWPFAGASLSVLPKPGAWMVRVKQALGVIILGTAIYYGYLGYALAAGPEPPAGRPGAASATEDGWYRSLEEGLAAADRENKPVLVDMWATWCKNCYVMDATTLADPSVTRALDGYIKVKFQAEDPSETPTWDVMERFGAVGLPTYVVLHRTE